MILDFITCDYPLPIPDELKAELAVENWNEIEFQTYSFPVDVLNELVMPTSYSIESDGQIYKEITSLEYVENENGETEVKEKRDGIEKVDYTGEVLFSHLVMKEDEDYFLDFSALFWKGELKELLLKDHKKIDNAKRKAMQKKLKKIFNDTAKEETGLYSSLKNFYKKCVRLVCIWFRIFLMFLVKLCIKIEGWLT